MIILNHAETKMNVLKFLTKEILGAESFRKQEKWMCKFQCSK